MICAQRAVSLADASTYLVELDDVGVANFFEDFDFASDAFNVFLVVDLLLLKNFHGHLPTNKP